MGIEQSVLYNNIFTVGKLVILLLLLLEVRTAVLLAAYYEKKENKQQAIQYFTYTMAIWKILDNGRNKNGSGGFG